jgi:hypothetical protein
VCGGTKSPSAGLLVPEKGLVLVGDTEFEPVATKTENLMDDRERLGESFDSVLMEGGTRAGIAPRGLV